MITITSQIDSIFYFDAWSGGKVWLDAFKEHPGTIDYLDDLLSEWNPQGLSETALNDFLWFDAINELQEAGLYNDQLGLFYDEDGFVEEEEED